VPYGASSGPASGRPSGGGGGGNLLALVELPRGLTVAKLAGGFGPMGASPVTTQIEDSYQRQSPVLPTPTRRLLLVAAAEPIGDPGLAWPAASRLTIGFKAATPANRPVPPTPETLHDPGPTA
jgi:hypothetical protein